MNIYKVPNGEFVIHVEPHDTLRDIASVTHFTVADLCEEIDRVIRDDAKRAKEGGDD